MDAIKARQIIKAVLELHAGHINHTVPMTPKSLQREMDLLQEAYTALGGDAKGAM